MINKVGIGSNAPQEVNVIIEIPAESKPVKYEIDKATGAMFVDRFMTTSMRYPCDYGYIPETLGDDGDPLDALVLSPLPLITGSVIQVRPIGMLVMTDEKGEDFKVLTVPITKLTTQFANIKEFSDVAPMHLERIAHFFQHYKDLETGKWVEISGWQNSDNTYKAITDAMGQFKK